MRKSANHIFSIVNVRLARHTVGIQGPSEAFVRSLRINMGSRTERLLKDTVDEMGFATLKVDRGGGGGYNYAHDAGDLIFGTPVDLSNEYFAQGLDEYILSDLFIVEEKYSSQYTNLQVTEEKANAVIDFAESIGGTPTLAVRWSQNANKSPGANHFLKDMRTISRTGSGNISVVPSKLENGWLTTEEFFQND